MKSTLLSGASTSEFSRGGMQWAGLGAPSPLHGGQPDSDRSLYTPLRRNAWSLSAPHKACQACLFTLCVQGGETSRETIQRYSELQINQLQQNRRLGCVPSVCPVCATVCVCSILLYFSLTNCIPKKLSAATYDATASALTELTGDARLLSAGVNLFQTSVPTIWPIFSLYI